MADKELGELAAALRNSVALQALITAGGADLATYGARLAVALGLGGAAGTLATDDELWAFTSGLKLITAENLGAAYDYVTIPIVAGDIDPDGADFWNGLVTATVASVDIASVTGLNKFPRFLELYANGQETTFTSTAVFDVTINFDFPLVIEDGDRKVLVLTNVGGEDRAMLIGGGGGSVEANSITTAETNFSANVESMLNAADNAAILTAIGAQTVDSDLTSIAALTTTAYGRAFLELANQAALMALLSAASTSAAGISELAINTEVNTGTSAVLAVTPDALAGSYAGTKSVSIEVFGPTTAAVTGDGKAYFMSTPDMAGMDLVGVYGRLITAGTTNTMDIQVANVTQGADVLSTKMTFDSTETIAGTGVGTDTSPPVISTSEDDVTLHDVYRIDVDAIHTTPATGCIVVLEFRLP